MKTKLTELEKQVEDILAVPEDQSHPAGKVLSQLWSVSQEQWERMERLTRLSDSYQEMMIQREKTLSERFDKHLRQLEKMTRISDRYQHSLRHLNLELEKTSLIDPLTELPNRRMVMKRLSQAFECQQEDCSQHKKTLAHLSVAMIDIDYFKRVNDEFGHQVGDDVLVALGKLMQGVVEDHGMLGRWGGEEFLVALNCSELDCSIKLMETLRQKVKDFTLSIEGKTLETSVSVGVAEYHDTDSMDSLLSRADSALYEAKSQGRNRVVSG
ncbi:diguanylate cyclase domain-containing protein [Marinomonas algarum]|uniref:diguanylate cyclase n=1 Tax=Marinomonas algarum TaxID=2883105 RepID=A0A9X1ILI1_9GAMM|nr:diguanylate cyclase [Marinomonas algarum]MCB5161102.1 GGDEF domain-containing protein [Marinomonas algarum]